VAALIYFFLSPASMLLEIFWWVEIKANWSCTAPNGGNLTDTISGHLSFCDASCPSFLSHDASCANSRINASDYKQKVA
jgi:hypothetical protein